MPYDHAQLAALAAVIRRGSFELAAAELSVTPSAISQRIRVLEEQLGAVLVVRGQPARATDTGNRLIRHFDMITLLERDLDCALRPDDKAMATVRLAVNADSLATWFLPALAAVDGMIFDIVIDDQDHSLDALRRGEVVAAVTSQGEPVQGTTSYALGSLSYRATASPDYMARWMPDGLTRAAAAQAPVLAFNAKDRLQDRWLTAEMAERLTPPEHRIAAPEVFVAATLAGLGWGMNPLPLIADHLAAGRLVALGPRPLEVALYWQVSRLGEAALGPLTRAVRRAAAAVLIAPGAHDLDCSGDRRQSP